MNRLPLRGLLAAFFLIVNTFVAGCAVPADTFLAPEPSACATSLAADAPLRFVSYNIRAARSSSLEDIAEDLETLAPDVVALQEVDRETRRSDGVDQAAWLAERLGMQHAYAAAREESGGDFGIALLSRVPFASARRLDLGVEGALEPRVAIDAELCTAEGPLRVVGVHADVWPWVSEAQVQEIATQMKPFIGRGLVIAGDLNAPPGWSTPGVLTALGLVDVVNRLGEAPTFQGDLWHRRLDYLFMDAPLAEAAAEVTVLESSASDHRPVLVEMAARSRTWWAGP